MAHVDWAVLCRLAFLDRHDRLCLIGLTTRLCVPRLPILVNQLMIVARMVDVSAAEDIQIAVAVVSPSGLWRTPSDDEGLTIELAQDYVFVSLRGIPLDEEGVHGFRLSISGQSPVSVYVPVLNSQLPAHSGAA